MNKIFKKMCNYPNYKPQQVFATQKKRMIGWFPSNTVKKKKEFPNTTGLLTGYTGKIFKDLFDCQYSQDYYLLWSGLDVDEPVKDLNKIINLCPEMSVRISTNGNGFHCFLVFENPIHFKTGETCQASVKNINLPYKERLESLGYKVDKYDHRVFFFYGGCNEWLYTSDLTIDVEKKKEYIQKAITVKEIKNNLDNSIFSTEMCIFIEALQKNGIGLRMGRNNIYIKSVNEALKGTQFMLNTKSPMKSNYYHINGYIDLSEDKIIVFANADSRPCLVLINDKNIIY